MGNIYFVTPVLAFRLLRSSLELRFIGSIPIEWHISSPRWLSVRMDTAAMTRTLADTTPVMTPQDLMNKTLLYQSM